MFEELSSKLYSFLKTLVPADSKRFSGISIMNLDGGLLVFWPKNSLWFAYVRYRSSFALVIPT